MALAAESTQTDGVKVEKTKGGTSKNKGENDGGFSFGLYVFILLYYTVSAVLFERGYIAYLYF